MDFSYDGAEAQGLLLDRLIDELINIIALCQMIQGAGHAEQRRSLELLAEVSYQTIKLCDELRKSQRADTEQRDLLF